MVPSWLGLALKGVSNLDGWHKHSQSIRIAEVCHYHSSRKFMQWLPNGVAFLLEQHAIQYSSDVYMCTVIVDIKQDICH